MEMNAECFALLDDASPASGTAGGEALPAPPARSRLYTGHLGTLRCDDIGQWPQVLEQMRAALAGGEYAVTLLSLIHI